MIRRTTIGIEETLLERAKEALDKRTIRGTVEEALRRVADRVEAEEERRVTFQKRYLKGLAARVDARALGSGEMWR